MVSLRSPRSVPSAAQRRNAASACPQSPVTRCARPCRSRAAGSLVGQPVEVAAALGLPVQLQRQQGVSRPAGPPRPTARDRGRQRCQPVRRRPQPRDERPRPADRRGRGHGVQQPRIVRDLCRKGAETGEQRRARSGSPATRGAVNWASSGRSPPRTPLDGRGHAAGSAALSPRPVRVCAYSRPSGPRGCSGRGARAPGRYAAGRCPERAARSAAGNAPGPPACGTERPPAATAATRRPVRSAAPRAGARPPERRARSASGPSTAWDRCHNCRADPCLSVSASAACAARQRQLGPVPCTTAPARAGWLKRMRMPSKVTRPWRSAGFHGGEVQDARAQTRRRREQQGDVRRRMERRDQQQIPGLAGQVPDISHGGRQTAGRGGQVRKEVLGPYGKFQEREGIAGRRRHEVAHGVRIGSRTAHRQQCRGLGQGQRTHWHLRETCQRRRARPMGERGHQHTHRVTGGSTGDEREHLGAGFVQSVPVVDGDQHRPIGARRLQNPEHREGSRASVLTGGSTIHQQRLQSPTVPAGQCGSRASLRSGHRISSRPDIPGRTPLRLPAQRGTLPHPGGRRLLDTGRQQYRPARPGAAHDTCRTVCHGLPYEHPQFPQLGLAADEPVLCGRSAGPRRGPADVCGRPAPRRRGRRPRPACSWMTSVPGAPASMPFPIPADAGAREQAVRMQLAAPADCVRSACAPEPARIHCPGRGGLGHHM